MTPVCTTLCKLEGECDGQLREYVLTRKDGNSPSPVAMANIQLCDKHFLHLDGSSPDLLLRRIEGIEDFLALIAGSLDERNL